MSLKLTIEVVEGEENDMQKTLGLARSFHGGLKPKIPWRALSSF
ncbi:MAG: hypothetical protein WBP64_02555 [Nitrososphaeraceae archaeon]